MRDENSKKSKVVLQFSLKSPSGILFQNLLLFFFVFFFLRKENGNLIVLWFAFFGFEALMVQENGQKVVQY